MVLTNCNNELLPLHDTETTTQTFYKNEHHHINLLHRQNASFNLFDSQRIQNNNSHVLGPINDFKNESFTEVKNTMPILSSNGYYGYVNSFSAVNSEQGTHNVDHQGDDENTLGGYTDSDMCVDEEVNCTFKDAGFIPFQTAVDKRKRIDEGLEGYYEPAKRRKCENEVQNLNGEHSL